MLAFGLLIQKTSRCMRGHASAGGEKLQHMLSLSQKDRGLLILRRFVVAGEASTTMLVRSFLLTRYCRKGLGILYNLIVFGILHTRVSGVMSFLSRSVPMQHPPVLD